MAYKVRCLKDSRRQVILTNLRIDILRSLTKKPKTAFELSKELHITASTIYRNLDTLGSYGLVQIFRVKSYRHLFKKYYMTTFKAFFIGFDFLKDLSYYFFMNFGEEIIQRWNLHVRKEYIEEFAKVSSIQELVEEEHKLVKDFLKETSFEIEDLNELVTFLMYVSYMAQHIENPKLKSLEQTKIKILANIAYENIRTYERVKQSVFLVKDCCKTFLNLLENNSAAYNYKSGK